MEEHSIELAREPREALSAAKRAASEWGAELTPGEEGGRLRLPVLAGLRRGWVEGELTAEPQGAGGTRLSFRVEQKDYHLQLLAVALLALGGAGGILLLLWPFFPQLLRLAPIGALLALGAWFLVLSRLQVSGPQEFLEMVAAIGGEEDAAPLP
ncbi:MAG TPA: hypothetical protein VFE33_06760 [Thermoanaerobaculia bacterium]|nr:hypothetical protein [Thermoanaerobaculia bacterium]